MTFGFDLGARGLGNAIRFRLGALLHFLKNHRTFLAGRVTNLGRLSTSISEEFVVLVQGLLCLNLSGLSLSNAAFDHAGTLIQSLLQSGQNNAPEQEQDQSKRNNRPDNVIDRGEQGVNRAPFRCEKDCVFVHEWAYPVKMK